MVNTQVNQSNENKAAQAAEPVSAAPKRRGRGISNETVGTTRLKFSNSDANPNNGLFMGHLESIEVKEITIGEDKTGMPSFNGFSIPKIVFTFASNEAEANKRKYVYLQFNAVESNVDTIPGGKSEWKVTSIFNWFKHLLDVYYLKGKPMSETEEDALTLNYEDYDENGVYVPVATEDVIAAWKQLFENFVNIMNAGKNGEPVYKTDGKPIAIWMKLLRYIKGGNKKWSAVNNGELGIPTFVGEGCIEIYKQNSIPSIKINPVRETIQIIKTEEKPKAPNMPNPMMGGVAASPMMNPMVGTGFAGGMESVLGDDEDMPFGD